MTDYDNRKENQAFEHVELLQHQRELAKCAESEHCCPESDKNYEAEQAKRERELREEDELFNNELARLNWGAMVWSSE